MEALTTATPIRKRQGIKKPEDFKPEEIFTSGPWVGKNRCQGWRYFHGRQCKKLPRKGKRTCRICGSGAFQSGSANVNYKTGLYSKDFNESLTAFRDSYERHLASPNSLSLADNIALVDSLISEQLGALQAVSGDLWHKARAAHNKMKRAILAQDDAAYNAAQAQLESLIKVGLDQAMARERVVALSDKKRSLVESERKKKIEDQLMIQVDQVNSLISTLVNIYTTAIMQHCEQAIADRVLTEAGSSIDILMIEGETT